MREYIIDSGNRRIVRDDAVSDESWGWIKHKNCCLQAVDSGCHAKNMAFKCRLHCHGLESIGVLTTWCDNISQLLPLCKCATPRHDTQLNGQWCTDLAFEVYLLWLAICLHHIERHTTTRSFVNLFPRCHADFDIKISSLNHLCHISFGLSYLSDWESCTPNVSAARTINLAT